APAGDEPAAAAAAEVPPTATHMPPEALAATLLDRRDAAGAAAAIDVLAGGDADHPALKALRARLAFVELATAIRAAVSLRESLAANPDDSAARHALAAHHAVMGDFATALGEWLELMRRDRKFGDEAARRSLLQAFDVLGEQDPFVIQYRRKMASLLH
ncbi:MAG: tetratricopeptide repeat protein, partial [Steroidobacteraceae bacterium]